MAQHQPIELTDTYQQVTTQPVFLVQNISFAAIELLAKDTPALEGDKGMHLKYGDAIPSSILSGTLYARALDGTTATLSVAE